MFSALYDKKERVSKESTKDSLVKMLKV